MNNRKEKNKEQWVESQSPVGHCYGNCGPQKICRGSKLCECDLIWQ